MKKLFVMVLGILLYANVTFAQQGTKVYTIYLDRTDPVLTSASTSGVSDMVIETPTQKRSQGIYTIKNLDTLSGDSWVFQINNIDWAGAATGTTFYMYYKESLFDTARHWAQATGVSIFNAGTALSGATLVQVPITPTGMGFMRFYFVPQGSRISGVSGVLKAFDTWKK